MVARLYNRVPRRLTRYRIWQARRGLFAFAVALLFLAFTAQSQHFVNGKNGTYKGPGLFQVKGQATGLPDTVTGTFEFFGANQTVPATNYFNLLLTGAGSTKSSQGGNFGILQTVNVAQNVSFKIDSGTTMTLDRLSGRLTEAGSVFGRLQKTVDLISGLNSSDFGGIGLSISWNGTNPGRTTVTRTSGSAVSVNGKTSIQRFFDIKATTDTLLNANLTFTFHSNELQGQNPSTLDLWRSPDGGLSWRRQRVSRIDSTITRTNIPSFGSNGRWAAADANNLLGIANYEWEADSLKLIAGNKQTGRTRKSLDTAFVARVIDAFNQPIRNQNVQFAFVDTPNNAVGQVLSVPSAITDSLGQVQTKVTLGSIKGNYRVAAFVPGVSSAIDTFTATAKSSIYSLIAQASKITDSVKSDRNPIYLTANDQDSLPVPQTQISLTVIAPDTIYRMSNDTVVTDASGKATASIFFGKKSGLGVVHAVSVEDPTVKTSIDLDAKPGSAAKINNIPVNGSVKDTVMKVKQFAINLFDSELNPRQGDTVLISLTKQTTSVHDSLLTQYVVIDTTKKVLALARLGEKVGHYKLTATAKNKPVLYSTQDLTATNDVPAKIIAGTTTFTDTIGAVVLQIAALLNDRYDNAVPFTSMNFAVTARPDSVAGGIIDSAVVRTDSIGRATNAFTIGTKIGTYQVNAYVNSIQNTFSIKANPGVQQQLLAVGGMNQNKPILSQVDTSLEVRVLDRANNPRTRDTVYFNIIESPTAAKGQSLIRKIALTNTDGYASTRLTLGDKVGTYKVQASSRYLNTKPEFIAKAGHGLAKTLAAYNSAQVQQKTILTPLDTFVVRLQDIGGNPVPDSRVTFAIVDTPSATQGCKLSKDTVWTDSLGVAKTVLTLGSKVGRYNVIAQTSVLPSDSVVRFYATATVGAAKMLAQESGNAQVGQLGAQLQPFVVQVRDIGGNFVPNTRVAFTILGRPDTMTRYDSLTAHGLVQKDSMIATTDSAGLASTSLILGNRPGRYTVRASVPGVRDTIFFADAIMLLADVNGDNFRNIGDLTAMIDHIIGRKLLTGYAFNSADIYPINKDGTVGDGRVNIQDLQYCLDSLLDSGWNPTRDWTKSNGGSLGKIEGGSVPISSGSAFLTSKTDSCYVQTTHIGSRFVLRNSVPIKGLQAAIYMKNKVALDTTTDMIYPRASMMRANVKSVGNEVSIILWNANNVPIEPGDSSIFRLPVQLTNNNVDSIHVLMSSGDNNDVALLNSPQEGIQDVRNSIPREWMLYQNYPNPFNPTTTIEFDVPEVAGKIPRVAIQIFNILGQHVRTIERGIHDAGRYPVQWNGLNGNGVRVASGVYFYRLLAGDYVSTKKMVMLK
ncbi:MAG: T9SS type A sorting domain-containing protein [Ignavibacteriales bacterium]|nr:T9SS type A sorting domain-containing protein [Ignavibacteriales bacterium]